jgi:ABC-type proline/glycine betaine transport system permease subunit
MEETAGQQIARNIGDIGSWIGTGFQFTRVVSFVLVGGITIAFIALLYNVIQNPTKAKESLGAVGSAASNVIPAGRVSKLLK